MTRSLAVVFLCLLVTHPLVAEEFPAASWTKTSPIEAGMDPAKLDRARKYALTGGGSGFITRGGRLVMAWGDVKRTYDLKSTSKSIGVTALGLAIDDGKIQLDDLAQKHHPGLGSKPASNLETGWLKEITIRHLATQTAGFSKGGGYGKLLFQPGTKWHYSDGGPNWLAECVTLAYKRDIEDLMYERILTPIGVERSDLRWRKHSYRPHRLGGVASREFGSGVHANVDAMARIGLLYLRRGKWRGRQLLSASFVDQAGRTVKGVSGAPAHPAEGGSRQWSNKYGNAAAHYGLLWWNNQDGSLAKVPRDAYWSWGLYDSLIVVIPSLDIVVSRAGKSWPRKSPAKHYEVLRPFLEPIAASVKKKKAGNVGERKQIGLRPPYPMSPLVKKIDWAPKDSIVRLAKGSDNWPLTWADDDHLYTAYGDGWGFKPRVPKKLSLGLARVRGRPAQIRGENIRSPTGEQFGGGASGKKASGLLMVDGVLYMWVRNAGNSQLAWSDDHGSSWKWAEWQFKTGFGYPTFLNFGKNYAGARDEFVYIYSSDSNSAYRAADRMVLARAPRERIRERDAYEFLAAVAAGKPMWTRDISQCGAAFTHRGQCYRGGVSYNPGLKRYLWCQVLPASRHPGGPRFEGGFGVYDAPEPWGPWTTIFLTEHWDVGPGETSSFPTKWMSDDGKTLHLVFSGDDCFSVRQAKITVR